MSYDKPFLNFVRAKASFTEESSKGSQVKKNKDNQGTLTGIEAKEFYDSVIKSPDNDGHTSGKPQRCNAEEHERVNEEGTKIAPLMNTRKKRSLSNFSEKHKKKNKTEKCRGEQSPSGLKNPRKIDKEVSCTVTPRLVNKFLQYAQDGRLNEIKKLLSETSVDINASDQFSWTALMCAAHSGHAHVVRYLLEKGALWKGVVNSQGKTALDLARAVNNSAIIRILEMTELGYYSDILKCHKSKSLQAVPKAFWCTVCQHEFTEDEKRHLSSTIHQFNCQHKPKGPYFSISEDNPGYKLMVKSGWDEEKGLGPEGEGRKFPIKTILKRDRYGLGSDMSSKARVTHFGPNDQNAIKIKAKKKDDRNESKKTLSKKQKRLKERKEKSWERNMRIYMNS